MMQRSQTLLADGRELFYYGRERRTALEMTDHRSLPERAVGSELRYDVLTDSWVIVAGHRQDRSFLPEATECPLCPSERVGGSEIPGDSFEVAVFENRYSALAPGAPPPPSHRAAASSLPLLASRPAAGRCEVVVYTDDHDAVFAELSAERIALVLEVLADRTSALSAMAGVEEVFCFENRGREIGVTQSHPHGQIYAYPFLTPRTAAMLRAVRAHTRRSGRNLFDDLVATEREEKRRVVYESAEWIAFVPYAARWPYELHCYPTTRAADLAGLSAASRRELPAALQACFGAFHRLFPSPAPYIAAWHQAPVHEGRADFACHLELFTVRRTADKIKYLAGSESAMDVFANDVSPEVAAERIREAMS